MTITERDLDALILEQLREGGREASAAELAYEVGCTVDAAERALARLCGQLLVRGGGALGCGLYAARAC